MAFDPGLVARVGDALEQIGEGGMRQKNVFGGRGFLAGTTAFVIVWEGDLLVKTPRAEYDALRALPGVTPFAPDGEKPMGTWLVVSSEEIADDPELVEWVRRGICAIR